MKSICARGTRPGKRRSVGGGSYGDSWERLVTRITTFERADDYISRFTDGSSKDILFCLHILERLAEEEVNSVSNPLWNAVEEIYHKRVAEVGVHYMSVNGYQKRYDNVIERVDAARKEAVRAGVNLLNYEGETFPGEFNNPGPGGSSSRSQSFNLGRERALEATNFER